jgi:cephalosporin hydroxylase
MWTVTDDFSRLWNAFLARGTTLPLSGNLSDDIQVTLRQSQRRTDISDHLLTLYAEAIEVKPKVTVELGTRGGESTRVLLRVAERCSGTLVSVDIEDCSDIVRSDRWIFVRSDDIELGHTWPDWARRRGLPEGIDFLFIDTSHLYAHTRAEIGAWFPWLPVRAKAVFHDTNARAIYRRRDGSRGPGWNNLRGVIRAIEEHLGVSIDERRGFCGVVDGWLIRHDPICNGLTVLRRLE